MGNTPNNNFPYPEPTGLVKDGAQNIEDLAAAIDTKLGVYATPGLTKIASLSFSGVSNQSFNDVFSSTYQNYKCFLNITSTSASPYIHMRLRVAGADNSGTNYSQNEFHLETTASSLTFGANNNTNLWRIWGNFNPYSGSNEMNIFNPQATQQTFFTTYGANLTTSTMGYAPRSFAGTTLITDSFTGFSLFPSTGTMTGSISIFGVAK